MIIALLAGCALCTVCGRRDTGRPIKVAAKAHPFLVKYQTRLEADFQQRYHRPLHLTLLPASGYDNRVQALLASADNAVVPDVVELDYPRKFLHYQAIVPLNRFIARWDFVKTNVLTGDFTELRQDEDHRIYGLSLHYPEPQVLALRRDVLAKSGLAVPGSVEELVDLVRALTAESGRRQSVTTYAWGWELPLYHLFLLAGNGALIEYDAATKIFRPGFTGTQGRAELAQLRQWYAAHAIPPGLVDSTAASAAALFRSGGLAATVLPLTQARELAISMGFDQVAIAGLPRGAVKPANGRAPAWCLTALQDQERQETAWQFIDWWFSRETSRLLSRGFAGPADGAAYDATAQFMLPLFSLYELSAVPLPFNTKLDAELADIILHERMDFQEHPRQAEIEEVLYRAYQAAMTGAQEVDAALEEAAGEMHKRKLLN
jgi:ABC-type glycerol-3-phosphate transport system substrate-binding protein